MLPPPVLEQVQAELRDYHGTGMSIMEMSHRSTEFEAINAQAESTFKRLLGLGNGGVTVGSDHCADGFLLDIVERRRGAE